MTETSLGAKTVFWVEWDSCNPHLSLVCLPQGTQRLWWPLLPSVPSCYLVFCRHSLGLGDAEGEVGRAEERDEQRR